MSLPTIKRLELDATLVEEGVWLEFDDGEVSGQIKLASIEKPAYQNKLGRMMTKAAMRSRRELEATFRDELSYKAMVGTIIMGIRDWKVKGQPIEIEFNEPTMLEMMQKWPTVRRFCQNQAADVDNFQPQEGGAESDNGQQPPSAPEARLKSGDAVPA
jgi:hypothetical protein